MASWVFQVQVLPEGLGGVQALGLEDLGDVPPGKDDDGVPVLADLLVGLAVDVRGGDQDAELPVRSREIRRLVSRTPTLFRGRSTWLPARTPPLQGHGAAEEVVPHGVPPAVTPWAGDVYPVDVGLADLPQVGCELLEVVRPVLEVLVDQLQQRRAGGVAAVAAWTG